jgi:hypothetical protein
MDGMARVLPVRLCAGHNTRGKAEAWCLLINAEVSPRMPPYMTNAAPPPAAPIFSHARARRCAAARRPRAVAVADVVLLPTPHPVPVDAASAVPLRPDSSQVCAVLSLLAAVARVGQRGGGGGGKKLEREQRGFVLKIAYVQHYIIAYWRPIRRVIDERVHV